MLNMIALNIRMSMYKALPSRRLSSVKSADPKALRSEVINLYKNLIYLSRDWHHDLKPQIKQGFLKNKDVTNPDEIRKLIERGEYISREIIATYRLKKYRAMKRRYYLEEADKHLEDIVKSISGATT